MRFPLALTAKIASYIIKHKIRGTKKFATVLQLEPLHTCNLTCTGCGRIREYSTSIKDLMPLEDCLGAAQECDAPMISICGGEPLIYPQIEALVKGVLDQGRIVYICTNAMFMRKKMREYLAAERLRRPAAVDEKVGKLLLSEELITAKDAEDIRKGPKDAAKPVIGPSRWMYWNVHLDGLERTHDLIVEREGVFKECILAIRWPRSSATRWPRTPPSTKRPTWNEIEQMFSYLSSLGVDGHTISPGYEYDAAKKDMVTRLNLQPEDFFLTRKMTVQKFSKIMDWASRFHPLRDAGLFRVPGRQAGPDLLGMGHPHPQYPRLEGPVLPDDGRPLRQLQGAIAGRGEVGQLRRRQWRREGCALRELHDALRL